MGKLRGAAGKQAGGRAGGCWPRSCSVWRLAAKLQRVARRNGGAVCRSGYGSDSAGCVSEARSCRRHECSSSCSGQPGESDLAGSRPACRRRRQRRRAAAAHLFLACSSARACPKWNRSKMPANGQQRRPGEAAGGVETQRPLHVGAASAPARPSTAPSPSAYTRTGRSVGSVTLLGPAALGPACPAPGSSAGRCRCALPALLGAFFTIAAARGCCSSCASRGPCSRCAQRWDWVGAIRRKHWLPGTRQRRARAGRGHVRRLRMGGHTGDAAGAPPAYPHAGAPQCLPSQALLMCSSGWSHGGEPL